MTTFTIDAGHNITAYANAEEAKQGDAAGVIQFDSQAALAKLSADWPLSRLVEIWNGIPGQTPVKKFQDRNKAVAADDGQTMVVKEQPSISALTKNEGGSIALYIEGKGLREAALLFENKELKTIRISTGASSFPGKTGEDLRLRV